MHAHAFQFAALSLVPVRFLRARLAYGVCVDEGVRQLAADSGALRSVHGERTGAGFATLAFVFERGILRLDCNADTDEVVASADAAPNDLPEILNDATLAPLGGKVVEHAWTMANDQGFADAFQVRCIDLDSRAEACVQVEAAAGVLMVTQVVSLG